MTKEIKKHETNMLEGSLGKKILLFAMPLAASSILQQLFNAADLAVIGNFAGNEALAAVGANAPVINLLVGVFVGLSIGTNVVIAKAIGQGNERRIGKAVHTSVLVSVLSGLILAAIGMIFAEPLLRLISTPDEILDLAVLYLRIIFLGMPFMMLYNFAAAILRSKGDTKRPLIVLLITGFINVGLNLFFVIVCGMSVDGVALATVIANVISAAMLVRFLVKEEGPLKLELKKLRIDWPVLGRIAAIGIPAGLQGMVFSFSNVCIQSALNTLGAEAIGGTAAALNYEFAAFYILNAFGQANVTFTGQNYGAGNIERCRSVCRWCMLLSTIFTVIFAGLFVLFRYPLLSVFTSDPLVAEYGALRLIYILSFEPVNMVIEVMSGNMRGYGYSMTPALICMAGVCGTRITWVYTLFPQHPTFAFLVAVFPVSWAVTSVAILAAYVIILRRIKKRAALPDAAPA